MIIHQHNPFGPKSQTPTRIVVHSMGEYIEHEPRDLFAADFLARQGLSAHALICPNGDVVRLREDTEGAWHAKGYNKDSLGVEVLVPGIHTYATFLQKIQTEYVADSQYDSLVALCKGWIGKHDIQSIDRHSDLSPGRKYDPGAGFPWEQFLTDVYGG